MIGLPFEFPEIMNCELKVLSLISELFTPKDTGIMSTLEKFWRESK